MFFLTCLKMKKQNHQKNQSHEHRPDDDYDFVYDERRTSNHRIKQ